MCNTAKPQQVWREEYQGVRDRNRDDEATKLCSAKELQNIIVELTLHRIIGEIRII